jgi:hypothetical protein
MKRIPARCEGEHTPLKMVSSLTLNKYSIDLSRLHYSLWLDLLDVLKENIWR